MRAVKKSLLPCLELYFVSQSHVVMTFCVKFCFTSLMIYVEYFFHLMNILSTSFNLISSYFLSPLLYSLQLQEPSSIQNGRIRTSPQRMSCSSTKSRIPPSRLLCSAARIHGGHCVRFRRKDQYQWKLRRSR